jgi:tRNA-dihydrouridine synthase
MQFEPRKTRPTRATFFVRDVPVYGDAILAPMDGYSDLPYRLICYELGSAMSYTEFTNAEAFCKTLGRQHRAKLNSTRPKSR